MSWLAVGILSGIIIVQARHIRRLHRDIIKIEASAREVASLAMVLHTQLAAGVPRVRVRALVRKEDN